jgi:hypothetical protein
MATRFRIFDNGQPVGHVDNRPGPIGTPARREGAPPQHPTMTFAVYRPRFDVAIAEHFRAARSAEDFVATLRALGFEVRPEPIPQEQ